MIANILCLEGKQIVELCIYRCYQSLNLNVVCVCVCVYIYIYIYMIFYACKLCTWYRRNGWENVCLNVFIPKGGK